MSEEYERHFRELLARRRRLRKLLRPLPRRANIRRYPVIKRFAEMASKRPYLWSFKREQVVPALYVGGVISLLPLYGVQFLAALGAALLFRANLTVLIALQFITNPFTIVPIYAFTGWVGVELMQLMGVGAELPKPVFIANGLIVGGIVVGLGTALFCDLVWRFLAWEARVFKAKYLEHRRRVEQARQAHPGRESGSESGG